VLPLVLQELETARALGIAQAAAARKSVQASTGIPAARHARLHVLSIGISDYGDLAKDLKLRFASRDAQDMASALTNTQERGGLYAEVVPFYLGDDTANKRNIFNAFASMSRIMGNDDFAVVMFSGRGAVIKNEFYLFPYDVDNTSQDGLMATAIMARELQGQVDKLAERGRVLVLLDACSGDCDRLRAAVASSNVTVLTSSTGDQPSARNQHSRENEAWQHGAFTKVLLDALSGSAEDVDTDHNGLISMSELAAYVAKNLPLITAGEQSLGIDQRFEGDIFVSGL
jgi:uncharacterized caspase-like protein